ncbi:uncharacterized protein TNCT_685281 [Trichonephila clavata]|uniref:Uncharacterized protein n=1 Tax=Trichonephila clavata TaxID=2740835 RepID=A0A8X6J0S6_TRICU|nr:uncharacterized protein TNCT_685281 [Trichonephila clavata]
MAYLGKGRIAELRYIARQLDEKVTDDLKMIHLKNLIVNSTNYEEEFVREMLNMIIEKRIRARTSRVGKYFNINERYILSTYELQTLLKLKKHNSGTINKVKSKSENVSLNPCMIKNKKNEVEMSVLRDTEASLDIGCKKFAAPEMFTEENGLPKLEIANATQVSSPLRKEVEEKSVSLTNEVAEIELEENLVKNVENLVPSFKKDDKDTMNPIKINVDEVTEALLKSEE